MGNCLIRQNKMIIEVMKTNGEILEHKPPMVVHQVLSQHADDAISDIIPATSHLRRQADMAGGQLYYLLPALPVALPESCKNPGNTVRIKVVISKQELVVMMKKGGVSVGDLVDQIHNNGGLKEFNGADDEDDKRWKPVLESISESSE